MRYVLAVMVLCAGCGVGPEPAGVIDSPDYLSVGESLTVEQAKTLTQEKGGLYLVSVTTLSDETARVLAKYDGDLYLDGLTTLSDEAAKALAQHEGWLGLPNLTTLSDEAAKALKANPEIDLPEEFWR